MAQQIINAGDAGLVARAKINDNFIETYSNSYYNGDAVVVINSEADLPTPQDKGDGLGTCHHLLDGKIYQFRPISTMILTTPLALPSSTHGDSNGVQIGGNIVPVVYVGSGAMIRSDSGGQLFAMNECYFVSGTGTNTLFDRNGSSMTCLNSTFALFASAGQITSTSYINFDAVAMAFMGGGLTITGNSAIGCNVNFGVFVFPYDTPISGTILTFNGALSAIRLHDCSFQALTGDSSLYLDPALTYSDITISHTNIRESYGGSSLQSGSLDYTDIGVNFVDVLDVANSTVQGHITSHGNVTATAIPAANTPTKLAATFILDDEQRVSTTTSGRMTYTGIADVNLNAQATMSFVTIASGTKIPCAFYFNHGNDTNNTISLFTDAGGGQVTVTHAAWDKHTIINGDVIVITNTTNYNGTYTVSNVVTDVSFEITATFTPEATGNWSVIDAKSRQRIGITSGSGNEVQVVINHEETYSTNDYLEIFVENRSTAADITAGDIVFIWRK